MCDRLLGVNQRPTLPPPQRELLDFLRAFVAVKGYAPSLREMVTAGMGRSTSTVAYRLSGLVGKGYITRGADLARAITISPEGEL